MNMGLIEGMLFLITSGAIFSGFAVFYRLGKVQENIENRFNEIDKRFNEIDKRFNEIDHRFDRIEERISKLEERLNKLETRVAVIESRLSDVATNVTHLMWQHQALPKQAKEE